MTARYLPSLFLGLFLIMPAAWAQDSDTPSDSEESKPRISVEFIVFARSGDTGHDEERWPENPGLPKITEAMEAGDAKAREFGLEVANDGRRLKEAAERLNEEAAYRVLRHERWIMPEAEGDDSTAIRVSLDEAPEEAASERDGQRQRRFTDEHLLDRPEQEAEADQTVTTARRPLDGTLRVYRNRFHHVAIDLFFDPLRAEAEPDPVEQSEARMRRLDALLAGSISFEDFQAEEEPEAFPGYRLRESRRIRPGEVHYLDHPRFGVIIRLDRVED